MIQQGSKVRMHYTLSVDGEVVETTTSDRPIEYVHGEGQIIPGLEERLGGMAEGERTELEVPPDKAYGARNPEARQPVPRDAFRDAETLQVGDLVSGRMQDKPFQARVVDVSDEEITLDLNHPLAGKTLHFAIEIVSVG